MAEVEEVRTQVGKRKGEAPTILPTDPIQDPLSSALMSNDEEFEQEELIRSPGAESNMSNASQTALAGSIKLEEHEEEEEDEDPDIETRDLFVTVDDPEKHTGSMGSSYVTYRIIVKTTRSSFDDSEYLVRRRYQDFLWLRNRLEDTQPTHLIPPLPEKHSLRRFDHFSPEFLKTRQKALNKFLTRIADHPVLSFNSNFQIFLTAKAWELTARKKQGPGILSRMGDSVRNVAATYMLKSRSPEYTMMGEYIQTFGEKMGTINRVAERLAKEKQDYHAELGEYSPVFSLWSNSETELADTMTSLATCIEKCQDATQELIDEQEQLFLPTIKEYLLYADSVKSVLKKRDSIQVEYELTQEDSIKKKNEREQVKISDQSYSIGSMMGKTPDEVKEQKTLKLEKTIDELDKQVEFLHDKTECANEDLKADLDRWHKNKRKDFKELFIGLADREIQFYHNTLSAWEEVIQFLQKQNSEGSPLEPPSNPIETIQPELRAVEDSEGE
uniref:Sorting nexin-30-like n=1 Tax=Saccoglossus kowalevskii TaxID=10224 RepID=A0ABM0LZA1_SACKO|nr:PREDICTED: sorting nexin-30-like [Saccoglossus kowalevskii]